MSEFSGKKILITGASRGFGKALALALLQSGASVFAVGKNKQNLNKLITLASNRNLVGICCDVRDINQLEQLLNPHQPFDILINNAGVFRPEAFLDVTEESYDHVLDVNLKAPFFISQIVAKGMVKHKVDGVILNVSSIGSKMAGSWNHSYGASKAGLDHLTRCLAVELGPMGIRVNSINPGIIDTDMIREPMAQQYLNNAPPSPPLPLQTWPTMEQYVDTALFLIGEKAKKITGTNFNLAGGAEL